MVATTVMGVVIIAWCGVTLPSRARDPPPAPAAPDLSSKVDPEASTDRSTRSPASSRIRSAGSQRTAVAEKLRDPLDSELAQPDRACSGS